MSAVETPPPPSPPQPAQRRCPRCGSALTGEQEWCLECGASVGATIAPPPSWRGPVALVAVLLTVAVLALVLALVELAGDAEQVAPGAATPTPAPTATPGIGATATPDSITIPPATGDESTTPEIADWPTGKDAWTIVLEAAATQEAATARATELAGQGVPVGILNSDEYPTLEPGKFVVFSGQYDSQRAATQGLEDLAGQVEGAYVRHVSPQASAGGAATATPSATATPPLTP